MTTYFIELGDVKRPVRFGFEGLLAYEQKTGRKALSDFAELSADLSQVSVTMMVDLVWAGLYAGYRKEGIPQDFDEFNVAEWLSNNPEAFESVMTVFAESFPQAEKKAEAQEGDSDDLTWGDLLDLAALIGMSEDEFWQATPRYFASRQKAFSKQVQTGWEQSRYVAFYSMYPHVKHGSLRRVTDLGLFAWEKEEVIVWAPIDPKELEDFNVLADSAHAYHTSLQQ